MCWGGGGGGAGVWGPLFSLSHVDENNSLTPLIYCGLYRLKKGKWLKTYLSHKLIVIQQYPEITRKEYCQLLLEAFILLLGETQE